MELETARAQYKTYKQSSEYICDLYKAEKWAALESFFSGAQGRKWATVSLAFGKGSGR